MRLLDTHEQISPRFLTEAFPDIVICQDLCPAGECAINNDPCPHQADWSACPNYKAKGIVPLAVGDYFSGKNIQWCETCKLWHKIFECPHNTEFKGELHGNLVEFKFGEDFSIHTEPLDRERDEFCRLAGYREKNPHVKVNAIWIPYRRISAHEADLWYHDCQEQFVRGFIIRYPDWKKVCKLLDKLPEDLTKQDYIDVSNLELITLLKELDTKKYKELPPYIKRSHDEPTDLAKALRIPKGNSSDLAIELSKCNTHTELKSVKGMVNKNGKYSAKYVNTVHYLDEVVSWYEHCIETEDGDDCIGRFVK